MPNTAAGNRQLCGCLRRCRGPALQGQQTDDQLQTVDQPVLEFWASMSLALRQRLLMAYQRLFAR